MPEEKKVPIKAYTKSELADFYGVSKYVIRTWLRRCHNEYPKDFPDPENDRTHLLSPKQVELFFALHGHPVIKQTELPPGEKPIS